ncbi:HIT family protein [Massilia sp. RP-1-19]|uniref:HIT family protein n=1 Tax=Massilia polaris TaxID=2728846 RepID=A0A848HTB1_9BURK|nr:HIT family protein [Massilia polaris]NML62961.1 HIT family protein [Massilia polaris]
MLCELCEPKAPTVYRDDRLSVILVDDAAYPGFCRVIWNDHVKEMSDLANEDRLYINEAVYQVELALVGVMKPFKVNLASLGNMVPHLHWHLIPRYEDDAQFPSPVWAPAVRTTDKPVLAARRALLPQLAADIARRLEKK